MQDNYVLSVEIRLHYLPHKMEDNRGSNQLSNRLQQYATGILH